MKRHVVPPLPHTNPTNLLATPEPFEVDEDEAKRKRKALGKQKSTEKRRQIERDATRTNRIWQEVKKLKIMSNIDDLDALKEYVKNIDTNKKLADVKKELVEAQIRVHEKEDELLKKEWEQLAEKVEWWSDFKKETKLVAIHNDDVRNRDLARTLKERHEDRKVMNRWKEDRKLDECLEIELTSEAARIGKLEEELRRWKQLVYAHRRKEKGEVGVVKMCISCREELE